MPDTKKQHYVPQFYLKRFADSNETFYAFNKFTKKSFRTTVRDAASQMRFYDIDTEIHNEFLERVADIRPDHPEAALIAQASDPQMIEHDLGKRESQYVQIFDEVLDAIQDGKGLTDAQRWYMSEFIALQILRTPEARRTNIEVQKGLIEELLKKSSESFKENFYVEFNESFASLYHAQMMFDPDLQVNLTQTIANHIWLFGTNTTSQNFYISDTPVVRRSHIQRPHIRTGYGSFGIEIALPLTPKSILIMCERKAFFPLAQLDEGTINLTSDHIVYYNSMQVLESCRSIYCPVGDFLLAADLSNAFPDLSNPERTRVQFG